jgi:hypothetical protein
MSFLILCLPRSRSYWISKYLSYPPFECGHDIILKSNSLKEFITNFSELTGSVELNFGVVWQSLTRLFPETKIVVVRRSVDDVYESLRTVGVYIPQEELRIRHAALINCAKFPGVSSIDYKDLNDPECCEWLFEHCLDQKWDEKWYKEFAHQKLQMEVRQRMQIMRNRVPVTNSILLEAAAVVDLTYKEQYVS